MKEEALLIEKYYDISPDNKDFYKSYIGMTSMYNKYQTCIIKNEENRKEYNAKIIQDVIDNHPLSEIITSVEYIDDFVRDYGGIYDYEFCVNVIIKKTPKADPIYFEEGLEILLHQKLVAPCGLSPRLIEANVRLQNTFINMYDSYKTIR